MGGHVAHPVKKRCRYRGFGGERYPLEDLGADGRKILKLIFRKSDACME